MGLIEDIIIESTQLEARIEKFVKGSKLKWSNIGTEKSRTYIFPEGNLTVHEPMYLNVNERNNHRIITRAGDSIYIPYKWVGLMWEVADGEPFFVL